MLHNKVENPSNCYSRFERTYKLFLRKTLEDDCKNKNFPDIGDINASLFQPYYNNIQETSLKFIGVPKIEDISLCYVGRPHLIALEGIKPFPSTISFWIDPHCSHNFHKNDTRWMLLRDEEKCPFVVMSAATGLSHVINDYEDGKGHVVTVVNDMASPLMFISTLEFEGTLVWELKNTVLLDEIPPKFRTLMKKGSLSIASSFCPDRMASAAFHLELVTRVLFKARNRVICQVTFPGSIDIPESDSQMPQSNLLKEFDKFDNCIRWQNFNFQLESEPNGVIRPARYHPDEATLHDSAIDMLKYGSPHVSSIAVLLDHYPKANAITFRRFLECIKVCNLPQPTPYNILAQYKDHSMTEVCSGQTMCHINAPKTVNNYFDLARRGYSPNSYEEVAAKSIVKPQVMESTQEVEKVELCESPTEFANILHNKYGCVSCNSYGNNRVIHGCRFCWHRYLRQADLIFSRKAKHVIPHW